MRFKRLGIGLERGGLPQSKARDMGFWYCGGDVRVVVIDMKLSLLLVTRVQISGPSKVSFIYNVIILMGGGKG